MGAGLVICCSSIEGKYEDERDTEPEPIMQNDNIVMRPPTVFQLSRSVSENTLLPQ